MATKRKPKQERSRRVVDAIVSATVDLFEEREDDSPSIRAIARQAGVGVASVYDYFEGRQGVLKTVFERVTTDNFDEMIAKWQSYDDRDLEAALGALLDDTIELYLGRGALTRGAIRTIMRLGWLDHIVSERDRFCGEMVPRFERDLPHVGRADLEATIVGCVDMIMGVVISELYREPSEERRAAARALLSRAMKTELERLRALESTDP